MEEEKEVVEVKKRRKEARKGFSNECYSVANKVLEEGRAE